MKLLLNIFKKETLFSKRNNLEVQISKNLVELYKKFDLLIEKRKKIIFEEYGYLIPNIRCHYDTNLENNKYVIKLCNNIVAKGKIYPERVMLIHNTFNSNFINNQKEIIETIDPASGEKAYWVKKEDVSQTFLDYTDVICKHIEKTCFKYINEIIDYDYVIAILEDYKKSQPKPYKKLEKFFPEIGIIRKVIVNLLKEEVSIRDINYFFEHLCEYYKFSQNADILSEQVRSAFRRQICLKHCIDNTLYVIQLSDKWQKLLYKQIKKTKLGNIFLLNPSQMQLLIKSTATVLLRTQQKIGKQPVIICSPEIRLPLYQLLKHHIPTIVVISYSELIHDIRVEAIETNGEIYK